MKLSKTHIALIALFGIILVLLYILIFRKPDPIDVPAFDDTVLREEIAQKDSLAIAWKNIAQSHELRANKYEAKSDSLEQTKPQIKHYYHEIYTFNSTANSSQLDSVIRANW